MLTWLVLVGALAAVGDDWVVVANDDEECVYILKKAVEQINARDGTDVSLVGVKHLEKMLLDLDLHVRGTITLVDLDIAQDYDVEVVRYPVGPELGIRQWGPREGGPSGKA